MGIIETLLEEIDSSDIDEQIAELSNKILEEEPTLPDFAPEGPNVFLTIEVPGKNKNEFAFLCLEREGPESFVTVFWSVLKKNAVTENLRKRNVWEIKEVKTHKIFKEFAKTIKFMKGE